MVIVLKGDRYQASADVSLEDDRCRHAKEQLDVEMLPVSTSVPHSTLKCNTSGGGDRFSGRMMLRIGQEAATVPVTKQERLPCPRATAT